MFDLSWAPEIVKDGLPESPPLQPATSEYDTLSPVSTSAVLKTPIMVNKLLFSGMLFEPKRILVGGSFWSMTFTMKDLSKDNPPVSVVLMQTL